MARPSKYKPEMAKQAAKLCALGATDQDLADFFEVSVRSIEMWRIQHPEFLRAIKVAKDVADERVERSLYQRATGYTYDAVKIMSHQGEPVIVPYREHCPPDPTSMIFWLKNRKTAEWRDKQEVQTDGKIVVELVDGRQQE